MATKKKKKSGGPTGKPPLSEPRVMVFSKFAGCDFSLSPRDFTTTYAEDVEDQSDLMATYMALQNNAAIVGMGTIETRQNLVELFEAPAGRTLTGVATLISDRLYVACDDDTVHHGLLPDEPAYPYPPSADLGNLDSVVTITDVDRSGSEDNEWTFLGYADDKLVGMTAGRQLWTGTTGSPLLELKNARVVPTPTALTLADLTAVGMTISDTYGATTNKFRIALSYTYLNRFGPTLPSTTYVFYASKPPNEWNTTTYVTISQSAPDGYEISAAELYYATGENVSKAFLARVDIGADTNFSKPWSYDWQGYLIDTAQWSIANLAPPTENYTGGVPASMMRVIDSQLYFWGGSIPHRVWIGGNVGNRFSVSTGTGGGYVDVEPGTGTVVSDVLKFKTQQGASIVTMLADNPNSSREHRFNLVESNIQLSDEQSVKGWQSEKIAGTVGCKSQRGAVVGGDGLYAVSRYGLALTTLTMEYNSQLQVQYVSEPISPVFLRQYGGQLESAVLFSVAGILYLTFGSQDGDLDNVIFCYDAEAKAWWSYTIDLDEPILNMIHIDHEHHREGIGIITANRVYLLPTTRDDDLDTLPTQSVLIESAELSSVQPMQAMNYLSQLEFRFDYFIGTCDIHVQMIDQFGRDLKVTKHVDHSTVQYQLSEYLRVDAVVESFKVVITGPAKFRMTHFLAKAYPKSNRVGMVWGFDTRASYRSSGSLHHTFVDYNDVKNAIIP
jgi:hypothetical protein